ncbi:MAG: site-2 protease family protein [Acidobacteria bacterium]|nr:MAG: site-2 protease family protein [Acidobacteriota bacterium]PYV27460.1 MAG: site-2 protease family protein [Acidobacteriota bacterium]
MRWSWKIGRLAGINVHVHATFLLLILFILLAYWTEGHSLSLALSGVFFVLVIFGCIVLHELGHALTARRYGIQTRDIILLPIGGVARLERMPEDPRQELRVALAGPAVNLVIAGVLFAVLAVLGSAPGWTEMEGVRWVGGGFLTKVMVANLWLAGFNVLPAFPMDGGRVLRALLATRMEYTRATQAAAHVGQAMAFLFGFIGILSHDPFLLFIALFVWMGASEEAAVVQMRTSLGGIPVQRVMLTDFHTLTADDTLDRAVNYVLSGWQQDFPVVFGDHVLGILTREDLLRTLAQHGATVPVREAMRRDVQSLDSHDMLETAVKALRARNCRSLPVEHNGRLVGMLTLDNVGEFILIESALRHARNAAGVPLKVGDGQKPLNADS